MIRLGIPDRLVLFHAPIITGRNEPIWYTDDAPQTGLKHGDLKLSSVEVIGDDVLTIYDTVKIVDYIEKVTGERGCLQD
jgi:riboflavin biosynthesis pyrimidine reductase